MCGSACHSVLGGQSTTSRSWFSPSTFLWAGTQVSRLVPKSSHPPRQAAKYMVGEEEDPECSVRCLDLECFKRILLSL